MKAAPALDSQELALERTHLAYDRTLLAWVRTALGIIGFGFTFYKFFAYLETAQNFTPRAHWLGPRDYALCLIIFGNVALLLATFQSFRARKRLREVYPGLPRSEAVLLALVIFIFGMLALVSTVFRL